MMVFIQPNFLLGEKEEKTTPVEDMKELRDLCNERRWTLRPASPHTTLCWFIVIDSKGEAIGVVGETDRTRIK